MLKRIATVALLAGVLAGFAISVVQEITTTPLILHAEEFENASLDGSAKFLPANFVLAHGGGEAAGSDNHEAWGPADGLERTLFTSLANILAGVGFAFILVGCYVLYAGPIDGRRGVIWGLAGFAVFSLGPGLGLAPEVPGSFAADLSARQGWWVLAAVATAAGLWLMVFRREWPLIGLGILIMALPHLIGAPHPEQIGAKVPPELAGHFAAASLVTSAIFWAMLGWFSGTFYKRFSS